MPLVSLSGVKLSDTKRATGSAAIYAAADFIASGRGKVALVIGAEKMTATPIADVGGILLAIMGTLPVSPYITTISFLIYVVCRLVGTRRDRVVRTA